MNKKSYFCNKNNYMQRLITFILLIVSFSGYNGTTKDFDIEFSLPGIPDSVCFLATYHGDKVYVKDTAIIDDKGHFAFIGDSLLPRGLYIIAGQSNNKILEFIINDDQHFKIESQYGHLYDKIKIKGCKENRLFFDYVSFINAKQKEIKPLYQSLKSGDDVKKKIDDINKEVTDYQDRFIVDNENTFAAAFIKATKEIDIPEPSDSNDSTFKYRYFKAHYWDNMPLSDDRFIRTPLLQQRLDTYINKITPQHADSIIIALDNMLAPLSNTSEIYKYILWYAVEQYDNPKIMGFDKIFVHLSNEYFEKGKTGGIYHQVVKNIIDRAKVISPLLIGKKAPNMILLDSTKTPVSLYDIEKDYTVIIFWDSHCSHCKKEIPKLKKFYDTYKEKYNMEVYAVSADTSITDWKKSVIKNKLSWINVLGHWSFTADYHDLYDIYSTPVIYLLDREKIIIAKRILTDQLKRVVEHDITLNTNQEK